MQLHVKEKKLKTPAENGTENTASVKMPAEKPDHTQKEANRKLRIAMNFSVIGLILSVFAGSGLFFGMAGFITALINRRKGEAVYAYAVGIGIAATVLSLVFASLFAVALILA